MKRSDAIAHLLLTAALGLVSIAVEHAAKKKLREEQPVDDDAPLSLSLWERAMAAQMAGRMDLGPDGETLRYDADSQHWHVGLKTGEDVIEQKLTVRDPLDVEGAVTAAMNIFYANEPKAMPEDTTTGSTPFVTLHPTRNAWRLWVPCEECGGHYLDLPIDRQVPEQWNARMLAGNYLRTQETCLNCQTQYIRNNQGIDSEHPAAWFDTVTGEWILWQPLGDDFGISVGLELSHFFHSEEEVAAAAHKLLQSEQ